MDLIGVREVRMAAGRADLVFAADEIPLGGGTWLFSEEQPGLGGMVDLTGLGWEPLIEHSDGALTIAATCTLAELRALPPRAGRAAHPLVEVAVDALLGSWKIHRYATVGGNICLALPAGPMTSLAAALDGVGVIWMPGGGERREPIVSLVTGVRETVLTHGEVLRAVELPARALASRVAHRRISLAELGRSGAFVIARLDADGGFTVTITAATPRPYQLRFAALPTAAVLTAAIDETVAGDWYDDPHGAPDWRRAMSLRFAEECRVELGTPVVEPGTPLVEPGTPLVEPATPVVEPVETDPR
ncbi:MAG: FAD binding domain-containing protein [Actinomycetota bacterium]|nr:FAD binding domain-containing protein [Actinomycetota bacterium]